MPHPPHAESADRAEVVETHISVVTFIGDRAYKLKKPVRTGFLDFSTREAREEDCRLEVELNRRLAPDVYLGVADVVMAGEVLDHLVVMRRMPGERRLSGLLDEPGAAAELHKVARVVAAFHAGAARSASIDAMAAPSVLLAHWEESAVDLRRFTGGEHPVLDGAEVERAVALARRYVLGRVPLFEARVAEGRACDGHGDLQADDIFCLDDGPRILDCIEFSDEYRWADALNDVAFLAMDLERLGHPELARSFLDRYRELSGDRWPASLEHHHVAYRAHVRAKVACLRVEQGDEASAAEARALHHLAAEHLDAGQVRLVLVGGLPGTGKSTLARAVADHERAVVLGSDELRKDLAGIDRTADAHAPPHEGLYEPAKVRAVYDALLAEAALLLEHGESVVLDASWSSAATRAAALAVADGCAAVLVPLRCDAPMEVAIQRIRSRGASGASASDADADVAHALAAEADPWPEAVRIDTTVALPRSVDAAVAAIRRRDDQPPAPRPPRTARGAPPAG